MNKSTQINELITDISKIIHLPKGPEKLLKKLVDTGYENRIALTTEKRKIIQDSLVIKNQTISNYLRILVQKKMIKRNGRGEFQFIFLTKSQWKEFYYFENVQIDLNIKYSPDDSRIFNAQVTRV